jgi:DNA-binding transcriptional regulator YiaG
MKYKSEVYEVVHQDAIADFKVGAISETELREFEDMCFLQEGEPTYKPENTAEPLVQMGHVTV